MAELSRAQCCQGNLPFGKLSMYEHTIWYCAQTNCQRIFYCIVFQQGTKELQLSLFQAIVVLLFNETGDSSLSYKEIQQLSNIGMLTCDQIAFGMI